MNRIVRGIIKLYQGAISPLFPRTCRFYPSCSEYARQAVARYGWFSGSLKAAARLARCHPFHPGGFDPVEPEQRPQASG